MTLQLGDMTVAGEFPAKLLKALAVIAAELHPAFDRQPWLREPGWSRRSCVLASLTVCDFLEGLGFGARVRPVAAVMRAQRGGADLHSLGIGDVPGQPAPPPGHWNGHMVVTVPALRLILDTTLYNAKRPAWPALTGMLATVTLPQAARPPIFGKHPIAGIELEDDDDAGYRFEVIWLDDRTNRRWRDGPDAAGWRRQVVLAALRDRFGVWQD